MSEPDVTVRVEELRAERDRQDHAPESGHRVRSERYEDDAAEDREPDDRHRAWSVDRTEKPTYARWRRKGALTSP